MTQPPPERPLDPAPIDATNERREPTPVERQQLPPAERVKVWIFILLVTLWVLAQVLLIVLPLLLSDANWSEIDTSVALASAFLSNGLALAIGYYFGKK